MKIDISNNIDLLTLEYFSNNSFIDKVNKPSQVNRFEKKFYRRRIVNETKKMLKNEFDNDELKTIFNQYIFSLIQHFKIIDTHELFQNYNNISDSESVKDKDISLNQINESIDIVNQMMIKPIETKSLTLDNFIIKHKKEKEINNDFFPEKKEINLNCPELKNKGIKNKKKKNIINV
jgi:hypothetical protein